MKDHVTTGDSAIDDVRVSDLSGDYFQLVIDLGVEEVQVVPIAGAIVVNERTHSEPVTNQTLYEMTSNEAGRPCDES
jgi:hypothetical protein